MEDAVGFAKISKGFADDVETHRKVVDGAALTRRLCTSGS